MLNISSSRASLPREPGQAVTSDYRQHGELRYGVDRRAIVGHNGTYFGNRPLYGPRDRGGVVLAGDRPLVRLLASPYVHGHFCAALLRNGAGRWLHACRDIEHRYRNGHMTWLIRDADLPGVQVCLTAVPLDGAAGFALHLHADGLQAGDGLVWTYGGARKHAPSGAFGFWLGDLREQWDPVYRGNPNVCKTGDPRKPELAMGPIPEWCAGNVVSTPDHYFVLRATADATHAVVGACSEGADVGVGDATGWAQPAALATSAAGAWPVACAVLDCPAGSAECYWAFEVLRADADPACSQALNPGAAFAAGMAYLATLDRVRIETPEPRLDAAMDAVAHAIDGACDRDPVCFRHGCMAWSIPFLGWRVISGATALGWHDRVKANAANYFPRQVRDAPESVGAESDPGMGHSLQAKSSRFWGRGRLAPDDNHVYNSQSQFFDQIIRDWRATADPELEALLRPALDLHLEWARACFDPDDDGLYESYINVLPTDCVWYSGGGSVEESAYVHFAHLAARDLARRAGDADAAERHAAQAEKIRHAVRARLWVADRGHYGLYVEQEGLQRLHTDAWVYSQFLPVDTGLCTEDEALQALYYTEWGLERIPLPFGGELCQPSNWVPSKWSVRDMFGGDLFHHALACFQTGLTREGWSLLLGATLETAFASAVPGGFSHIGAGTDFADNSHMFARAVVEGLFGYVPDYPNDMVHVCPSFPADWPTASIRTPDFSLHYSRADDSDRYVVTLARPAKLSFLLPVLARRITQVTVNGQPVAHAVAAGFGHTRLAVRVDSTSRCELVITVAERLEDWRPAPMDGVVGDAVRLAVPNGAVSGWADFHGAIEVGVFAPDALCGCLAARPGHHLVVADVMMGELPQRHVFKLSIADPVGARERAARTPRTAPRGVRWECLDLFPRFNGDIRSIFQHAYRSPRAPTVSPRLAENGYASWTMVCWKDQPPVIDLDHLPALAAGPGRILTPQQVPFAVTAEHTRNIAFTSLWDNWPRAVTVPVGGPAAAIWMLVCGFTTPMQTRIANAVLRFRFVGGGEEHLDLVPPLNFWSLCPWGGIDYSYEIDAYCLPPQPPPQVQLGNNCRAMVLGWVPPPGVEIQDVTLEAQSPEVVVGLMGISLVRTT